MVEHRLTVSQGYAVEWTRPEIDLNELAKLRWDKKWTLRQLAAHFERPKTSIVERLRKIRPSGGK